MTFAEMQVDVRRGVRELAPTDTYFSDEDIRDALNAGYMELSDASEWLEGFVDMPLLFDRPYYDLFSIIGPDFLSVKPAFDTARNRWLEPSTVRQLDLHDPRWERVVGTPQRIFLRGLRWLGLYPRIHAEGDTIRLYHTRLPVELCEEGDEPGFPEAYHIGCVHFAVADLFAQDGETRLALGAWKDYTEVETALIGWVQGRTDRPILRVFGAATSPR
jgi:hypothetical protein